MARTRSGAKCQTEPMNANGMTWSDWHRAAGKACKIQNLKSKLRAAWEAGEDPCDWRAAAEQREHAARSMVKP